MNKHTVVDLAGRDTHADPLTEMLRTGARQLIHQTVEAELDELLGRHSQYRTEDGRVSVVRNGYLPERELQTGVGPVTVRIPKVRSKTGEPVTFRSVLVPPYVRKTKSLEAALPWLYLKGVSSGEMGEALKVLVGRGRKHSVAPEAGVGARSTGSGATNDWIRIVGSIFGLTVSTVALERSR